MIQIKADAAIKAAFNKAISVMGADVEWCEIFVINNNSIILPGKRRSLVFSFDNRKLINTIIDVDVNVDSAIRCLKMPLIFYYIYLENGIR